MKFRSVNWCSGALALCLAAGLTGCDENEASDEASEATGAIDAGSSSPAVAPELAKALAEAKTKPVAKPNPQAGGPPPNGVFAAGQADQQIEPGKPAKVELGEAGSEPQQLLSLQPKPKLKKQGTLQVVIRNASQQPLPLSVSLSWSTQAAKGSDNTKAVKSTVRLEAVAVQGGAPPPLQAQLDELKGASFSWLSDAQGGMTEFKQELTKASAVAGIARQLGEVIQTIIVTAPSTPVGSGAVWMQTDRTGIFGLDTVSFKVATLSELSESSLSFSTQIKRYAATKAFDSPLAKTPEQLEIVEFTAPGQASVVIDRETRLPRSAELEMTLAARLGVPGEPQRAAEIHSQVQASLQMKE